MFWRGDLEKLNGSKDKHELLNVNGIINDYEKEIYGFYLKSDKKVLATLYDISDDLSWKSWHNFTLKHFAVRVKMYNEEEFDYKIYNIRLKDDICN